MAQHAEELAHSQADPVARVASDLRTNLPQFLFLARAPASDRSRLPYNPPTDALRSEVKAAIHERAVQDIARQLFAFPTPRHSDYKTYSNHPQRSMGVQMANGSVAYPDIVVVQHPENYTKILAEVETSETVTEDVGRYEWLPYAHLAPLYLYVPVGCAQAAKRICKKLKIPIVGLRTWRYVLGYEELEVTPIST
ncbi:MAG: hypothetical protein ACE5KW_03820 [Dehalococcoidia bacterium]